MLQRFQFHLSSLLILTAMCAAVFGLGRLMPLVFSIAICVIPFCLIVERFFQRPETNDQDTQRGWRAVEIVAFLVSLVGVLIVTAILLVFSAFLSLLLSVVSICSMASFHLGRMTGGGNTTEGSPALRVVAFGVCAFTVAVAATISLLEGNPTLVSPLPFLVVMPSFFESHSAPMDGGVPLLACIVIPVSTFFVLGWPITRKGRDSLPPRIPILLVIATVLSGVWFAAGLGYSIEHNDPQFTIGVTVANVAFPTGIWLGCYWLRRNVSFAGRLALCTLLHYWLFWCAFPWLGELI